MSFFGGAHALPTNVPKVANLDASDTSSNQEGVPVAWGIGRCKRALHWLAPQAYNFHQDPIRTTTGSGKSARTSVTGFKSYGDIPAGAGLGLARRIRKIVAGNGTVWEGNVVRSDDPLSPDYWRAHITTDRGDAYIYWGRNDQPVDDILLAGLAAADDAQWHPAYRGEILVILKNWYFGDNVTTAPNMVLYVDVEPTSAVGTFAPQDSAQGESMVAGIAALASHPIYGAGLPAEMFDAAELEALSAAVIADCGCHSPFLDRAQPLRDVITDLLLYFGGWARLQEGKLRFGRWPHNGIVPGGLTELGDHDFTERPETSAGSPSATINDVTVTCRDAADSLKEKPVQDSASENVEARQGHEGAKLTMLGFVDLEQARGWVNKAASAGAEGQYYGRGKVREPRAIWAGGDDLRAGDNFNLDLSADEVDQVCRITRRTDPFLGPAEIEFKAEPGVFPTPYIPQANPRPDNDTSATPNGIAAARVWELPPAIYGSPIGLPISVLAKRPLAVGDATGFTTASVVGFNIHHSATGASYDVLGSSPHFAVRGTLRTALDGGAADVVVQLTLDADNLDRTHLAAQSTQARENDTLLILIGDELFSTGAMTIAALDTDFTCARARRGTLASAHAAGSECWVFYRAEIRAFIHGAFVEDADRYFKLQPYTRKPRELADCAALLYHFRDRAPEAPVIVLTTVPVAGVVGVTYTVAGTISDVNGDLTRYEVVAVLYDGAEILAEITLLAADTTAATRALVTLRTRVAFPQAGTWKLRVRAWDETGALKELLTAAIAVAEGTGVAGADDGVTPDAIDLLTVTVKPGVGTLNVQWELPGNTPIELTEVYVASVAVRPAMPKYRLTAPQNWVFDAVAEGVTQYYWFRPRGRNKRYGPYSGPKSGTAVVWPRVGGGGETDIILRAPKIVLVNNAGANERAPFAVVGDYVFLDMALIRAASIDSGMIYDLVAEKLRAGDLTAMVMLASKTATDTQFFNAADRSRGMPATSFQQNENGTHVTGLATTPLDRSLVTFGGWLTGSAGYAEDRFGKPTMRFSCQLNGGSDVAAGQWLDLKITYRINGGSWVDVTPFSVRALDSNGGLNISGGCIIAGLVGTDVIEFGVRVTASDDISQLNVTNLAVQAHNA